MSLVEGKSVLRYSHPAGTYTVFLRDLQVEPGTDPPLLAVQMAFYAPSLAQAKEIAESHLKEFFDYVTVVTNCKFRIHRISQIFDWEPGDYMRECMYFTGSSSHDVPIAALSDDLFETIALFQQHPTQPRLRRALKWFGNGVASAYRDDQFTYFWFALEVLAQIVKAPAPIPDRCPVCRGALFCPACGISHLHRPYPKQAIQQLFAKYVGSDWESFYALANEVRNRMLHGDEVLAIEADLKIDLSALVDRLGRLAWTAVIDQFRPSLAGRQISLLKTNRYVHMKVSAGAHLQVGFAPNFDDPDPASFPKIQVSIETK